MAGFAPLHNQYQKTVSHSPTRPGMAPESADAVQQTIGNQAMLRMRRATPARIQRACSCGGTCSKCQAHEHVNDSPREENSVVAKDGAIPPIVDEVVHSQGQPLDASTRAFAEPRF